MGEYSTEGFKAKIHNEREVTLEDIANEGQAMWTKCCEWRKEKKVSLEDLDAAEDYMGVLRKEHPEFTQSYPIVLRYMVQFGTFKRSALMKYLVGLKNKPWKSEDEYLDSQADYVVILYKETTTKRWNQAEIGNIKNNIRNLLKKEHELFKKRLDYHKERVETKEKELKSRNRRELIELVKNLRIADIPEDSPVKKLVMEAEATESLEATASLEATESTEVTDEMPVLEPIASTN